MKSKASISTSPCRPPSSRRCCRDETLIAWRESLLRVATSPRVRLNLMKCDLKCLALTSVLMLGASRVCASTPLGDYVTFSGFGTLGMVQTDLDSAQFVRDHEPAGATRHPSFNVDSDLGLQLTAQPTKWLSGTVQTLTEQRSDVNLSTEVEWAFIKVEPLDGFALRGGRMALPMFTIS